MKNKLILLILVFYIPTVAKSSNIKQDEETTYYGALKLEDPYIRVSLPQYLNTVDSAKLILGEGHIKSSQGLAPEYREGGEQELSESMLLFTEHTYDFHENVGYYTASAELGGNFSSDWCGNLTNLKHRQSLFVPNTYDMIFDATYHPGAICEDLFSDVARSLKSSGVFIFQLPIFEEDGFFMSGHGTRSHEMPWYSRELKFKHLQGVYNHWQDFLVSKGFTTVVCYQSPITIWMKEKAIQLGDAEKWTTEELVLFKTKFQQEIPEYSKQSKVYQLDSHLAHYGLSTHYIIAGVN